MFSGQTHCTEVSFLKNSDTSKEPFLYLATLLFLVIQKIDLGFKNSEILVVRVNSWSVYLPNFPTFWPFFIFPVFEQKRTKIVNVN